jgi:hypothetical protein
MRRNAKGVVSWGLAAALILIPFASVALSQVPQKGHLIGYVFDRDGSTPVAGAVILVKNLTTGAVTEAAASDGLGAFKVPGLDPGLYALGVKSAAGNFNSREFFGVQAQKTSKISIALDPYDPAAASAAEEVIKEQRDKGEAYVGKVVRYDPATKTAEVFVEIGLVQKDDRIHVKGQVTDFYQDLNKLAAYGTKTERVTSGYTAAVTTSKSCAEGDFVYVVCRGGILPFFLVPLGVASIVAGAVPFGGENHVEPFSAHKIK